MFTRSTTTRRLTARLALAVSGALLVTGGVPALASAADQGCDQAKAGLRSVQQRIDTHNATPHVFVLPEQQAQYSAYNAEADQLEAEQSRALDAARSACGQVAPAPIGQGPSATPTGGRGKNLNVVPPVGRTSRNMPTTIFGRNYSGHVLDQMQGRGIIPSAVEDTIRTGRFMDGKNPGTVAFHSAVNNLTVVINRETGRVVTATWGLLRQTAR